MRDSTHSVGPSTKFRRLNSQFHNVSLSNTCNSVLQASQVMCSKTYCPVIMLWEDDWTPTPDRVRVVTTGFCNVEKTYSTLGQGHLLILPVTIIHKAWIQKKGRGGGSFNNFFYAFKHNMRKTFADSHHYSIYFKFFQFRNSHNPEHSSNFRHFNSNPLLCYFWCVHKVKKEVKKSQQPRYMWCLVSAHLDGLRKSIPSVSHASLLKLSQKKTRSPIKQ